MRALKVAVEVVVFLFGAFAGFLPNIAPPAEGTPLALGIAQFSALAVLLLVSALTHGRITASRRRYWLVAAGVFFAGFLAAAASYYLTFRRFVFLYPPGAGTTRLICGAELGPCGKDLVQAQPELREDCGKILFQCGDPSDTSQAWTQRSERSAEATLTTEYVLLVGLLSATLFTLIEVGSKRTPDSGSPPKKARQKPGRSGKSPRKVSARRAKTGKT